MFTGPAFAPDLGLPVGHYDLSGGPLLAFGP